MNRCILKNRKRIALLAALLAFAAVLAACRQEAPAVTTEPTQAPATEASVTTVPEETETIETYLEVEAPAAGTITYEEYLALPAEVQQAYAQNFETMEDFLNWIEFMEAEYNAEKETEETDPSEEETSAEEDPAETEDGIYVEAGGEEDW